MTVCFEKPRSAQEATAQARIRQGRPINVMKEVDRKSAVTFNEA